MAPNACFCLDIITIYIPLNKTSYVILFNITGGGKYI